MTGHNLSHSQPTLHYLISSNASHSIHLFLAQWRLISSESAVTVILTNRMLRMCSHMLLNANSVFSQQAMNCMGYFTCNVKCDRKLQEICAINGPSSKSNKTAVLVIISMQSLVLQQQSPRRTCDNKTKKPKVIGPVFYSGRKTS